MNMPTRNDDCPCKSGKKFKNCCMNTIYYNDILFRQHVYRKYKRCRTSVGKNRAYEVYSVACRLSVVEIRQSKTLFAEYLKREKLVKNIKFSNPISAYKLYTAVAICNRFGIK